MGSMFPAEVPKPLRGIEKPVIRWKWMLIGTGILCTFLLWECGSGLYQGRRLSDDSVRRFHDELNQAQYGQILDDAATGFRQADGDGQTVAFLTGVHTKLGNALSANLQNVMVNATLDGTRITTRYTTEFQRGTAQETFVWIKDHTGLRLLGYNIQSNAFVTN